MRDRHAIIILAILVILYFWPYWLKGITPILADNLYMNYPLKSLAYELLSKGIFPHWNEYIYSGFPLFASMQAGILYPLNWLFMILPHSTAFSLDIILTYFIAATGMFFYCKHLTNNTFASLFSGITFAFSSFMMFKIENLPLIQEASLVPFIFLFLNKANLGRLNKYSFLAVLFLSFQYFIGHPQITFYTLLVIVIHQLYFFFSHPIKPKNLNFIINGVFILITGTFLASVQLLPSLHLALESARLDNNYQEYVFGSWSPVGIFTLIFPYLFGGSYGNGLYSVGLFNQFGNIGNICCYAGIIPLIVAVFALFSNRDNKYVLFWSLTGVLAALFALGLYFPLYKILYHIPGFNFFRFHCRYLLFFNIAICVISSIGLTNILELEKKQFIRYLSYIITGIIITSALALIFLSRLNLSPDIVVLSFSSANVIVPFATIVLSIVALSAFYYKHSTLSKLFLTVILVIDLFICFGQFIGWRTDIVDELSLIKNGTNGSHYLQKHLGPSERVLPFSKGAPKYYGNYDQLEPDYSMLFKLRSLSGYEVLKPKRYISLFNSVILGEGTDLKFNHSTKIEEMFGCKYFILPENKIADFNQDQEFQRSWKKVYSDPSITIYLNNAYLPKAWFVTDYQLAPDFKSAVNLISTKKSPCILPWNPGKKAFIEQQYTSLIHFKPSTQKAQTAIKLLKYSTNEVIFDVINDRNGLLIVNDSYYPIWKCYVNKKKTTIVPVNVALRGVPLKPGNHRVKFVIEDDYFNLGVIISLLTAISLITLSVKGLKSHPATRDI